jgi:outer membrane autotransporter protein
MEDPLKKRDWNLYAMSLGGISRQNNDSQSGYPGHDAKTMGFVIGSDKRLGDGFIIGVDGGYAMTNVSWNDLGGSSGEADLLFGSIYGGYLSKKWNIFTRLSGGLASYDTDRRIAFTSCLAKSNAAGMLNSGEIGGSYDIMMGGWLLKPNASLRYANLSHNGYKEGGANDDLNLTVEGTTAESLESSLGIFISRDVIFNGMKITPDIRVAWHHEFMSDPVTMKYVLPKAENSRDLKVKGPERGIETFMVGAGLGIAITDRTSAFVSFKTTMGDTERTYTASAGMKIEF